MTTRPSRFISITAALSLLGVLAYSGATAQDGQPDRPPQRQPEGQPGGGQPGGPPGGGRPGGRGEAPAVRPNMMAMNRAIGQLKDQIGNPANKEACLKLIGDAQRGCIGAKSAVPPQIRDIKDEAARAKASESFRRHLMALARKLLDIEQNILDGKTDDAKAQLSEVIKMRDAAHQELGVGEDR